MIILLRIMSSLWKSSIQFWDEVDSPTLNNPPHSPNAPPHSFLLPMVVYNTIINKIFVIFHAISWLFKMIKSIYLNKLGKTANVLTYYVQKIYRHTA